MSDFEIWDVCAIVVVGVVVVWLWYGCGMVVVWLWYAEFVGYIAFVGAKWLCC
jgi:hypothetical protein